MTKRPSCRHVRLVQCPLTVEDWGEVYRAWQGFLTTCRLIAERAHERLAARVDVDEADLS